MMKLWRLIYGGYALYLGIFFLFGAVGGAFAISSGRLDDFFIIFPAFGLVGTFFFYRGLRRLKDISAHEQMDLLPKFIFSLWKFQIQTVFANGACTWALIFVLFTIHFGLCFVYGINPIQVSTQDAVKIGGVARILILDHQYWRLFSAVFIHDGVSHLVGNCVGLLSIGTLVERQFGKLGFVKIFLITGVVQNVCAAFLLPSWTISLGASAGIFGLYGAFIAGFLDQRSEVSRRFGAAGLVGTLVYVAQTFIGAHINNHIDYTGHFIGLILGIFVGLYLVGPFCLPKKLMNSAAICSGIAVFVGLLLLPFSERSKADIAVIRERSNAHKSVPSKAGSNSDSRLPASSGK